MSDLSKLNDEDLKAIAEGRMSDVSDDALNWIANPPKERSLMENVWTEITKGRQGTTPYNSPVGHQGATASQLLALSPLLPSVVASATPKITAAVEAATPFARRLAAGAGSAAMNLGKKAIKWGGGALLGAAGWESLKNSVRGK